jgi:hypothetical protein
MRDHYIAARVLDFAAEALSQSCNADDKRGRASALAEAWLTRRVSGG